MNSIDAKAAAAREKKKADIVLKNGQLVNVFSGQIYPAEVAIIGERVAEFGEYEGIEEIDLNGRYILPGFIDSYLRPESTRLTFSELARAIVPHGTTAVVADLRELESVLGEAEVKSMLAAVDELPLNIYKFTDGRMSREAATLKEAEAELKKGGKVLVCEGSLARNMEAILPLINPANSQFFSFCTHEIYPSDLAEGHMDNILKRAVALKFDPVTAVQMATINPARLYDLAGQGAVAPGYFADINIVSNLLDFGVDRVFKRGKQVAVKRQARFEISEQKKIKISNTVRLKPLEVESFEVKAGSDYARVIELVSGQITTKAIVAPVKKKEGRLVSDPGSDVLKAAVIEMRKASGRIGIGLVKGTGLKKGALATSIEHNAQAIVCVGIDDEDIISAVRRVARLGGGSVAVRGGLVLAEMPLPVAGLMSDKRLDDVRKEQVRLDKACVELGCKLQNPFGMLASLTLTDIPELRLTDKELVDALTSKSVGLFQ